MQDFWRSVHVGEGSWEAECHWAGSLAPVKRRAEVSNDCATVIYEDVVGLDVFVTKVAIMDIADSARKASERLLEDLSVGLRMRTFREQGIQIVICDR